MNTSANNKYDYIVTGGGCAGLSLVMQILHSNSLASKSILLVEKEPKNLNDRTWCFWEKEHGLFESIVFRKWEQAWFKSKGYVSLRKLAPYQYKMIRGIDFYAHCIDYIKKSGRVDRLNTAVTGLENIQGGVCVKTELGNYEGQYVFNSIQFGEPEIKKDHFYLLQHFKGWVIETENPSFNSSEATLMDFSVEQDEGTTFIYVMPFSDKQALVEYTLFTPSLLEDRQYESALKKYIEIDLGIKNYTITEKEYGVIPMTDHQFPDREGNIIFMGTAGGLTKPSSGYTFKFIQKHVQAIVKSLVENNEPFVKKMPSHKRFLWYDRVLLHVLFHRKMQGSRIFQLLFKRNNIPRLFAFLDNESNMIQELYLLNTLPQWPFLKAGVKELFKSKKS